MANRQPPGRQSTTEARPTGRQRLIDMNKLATYLEAQIIQQTMSGHDARRLDL